MGRRLTAASRASQLPRRAIFRSLPTLILFAPTSYINSNTPHAYISAMHICIHPRSQAAEWVLLIRLVHHAGFSDWFGHQSELPVTSARVKCRGVTNYELPSIQRICTKIDLTAAIDATRSVWKRDTDTKRVFVAIECADYPAQPNTNDPSQRNERRRVELAWIFFIAKNVRFLRCRFLEVYLK